MKINRIRVRRSFDDQEKEFDSNDPNFKKDIVDWSKDGEVFVMVVNDINDLDNPLKNFVFAFTYAMGILWIIERINFLSLKPWVKVRLDNKRFNK